MGALDRVIRKGVSRLAKSPRNVAAAAERAAAEAEIRGMGGSVQQAFESRIGRVALPGGQPRAGVLQREVDAAREALRSGAGLTGEQRVVDIAKREAAGTSLSTQPVVTPKGVTSSSRPKDIYGRPTTYPKGSEAIETPNPYMAAERPGLTPRTAGEAAARREGQFTREVESISSSRPMAQESFVTRSMGTGPTPTIVRGSRPNPRAVAERRAGTEAAATGSTRGVATTSRLATPSGTSALETVKKAARGGMLGITSLFVGEKAANKVFGRDRS